ncbi:hypothetical protein SUGI_0176040 [Cryptomeria japonica]|uniref:29 kDa ribonucleoprotein B, chloroplastic n=1 Tax=Cryptomeria japonica TaxID=3369 RepID=UPI002408C17C|nr:29 kDa ribonucleoprotein B, chloroplastic [Cryptomeria japonica]GLJ11747.1 hypothetical protein SUGI_0176040 [Cryptomeria japonica]
MAASASFSVATAHVHFNAMPPLIELPLAKATCSRAYMPSACALEVSYSSSSSSNNALVITPLTKKKRVFKLFSSIITQEGMPLAANEEEEEPQLSGEETSESESGQEASAEYTQESEPPVGSKIYVGNLPYSCDSAELAGLVQEYGSAEIVEVIYDRDTGRSRGFAFVTMSSPEDANAVIENLNGRELGGRSLKVNLPEKPRARERPSFNSYADKEHKVFIGNLAWSVNDEILTEVFSEHGNVVGAKVLYDETGRSRGFGFVSFSSHSEVEAAVASLNGTELEGRPMRVDVAIGRRS